MSATGRLVSPSSVVESLRRSARRGGFTAYHSLVSLNYRYELLARRATTAAGPIRTYELAATHGDDTLLRALHRNAGPADTIYDIGAYVGEYALALAAEQPDRTVVAFEPDPGHCERFEKNRRVTDPAGTVSLERIGIGETDESRTFYHSSFPKLSSFDRADATRWGGRVTDTTAVPVRRLDSLLGELPPPDHIKIDVEGFAPHVLRGGRETIERHQPVLYIEPHDREGTNRSNTVARLCRELEYVVAQRAGVYICCPPGSDVDQLALSR